jgi:hypothetical protein
VFEGLDSRLERNRLLDELYGDLDSLDPQSMRNRLEGFAFEPDVPLEKDNAASSINQEAA